MQSKLPRSLESQSLSRISYVSLSKKEKRSLSLWHCTLLTILSDQISQWNSLGDSTSLSLLCHISSKSQRNWLLALTTFRRNMKNVKKKKRKRLTSNWIKTCSFPLMRFSQLLSWLVHPLQLVLSSSLPSACNNNHLSVCSSSNHLSAWHHLLSVCLSLPWDSIQLILSDNSENTQKQHKITAYSIYIYVSRIKIFRLKKCHQI